MKIVLFIKVLLLATVSTYACTGFNVATNGSIYTAANMDWNTPYSNIRFIPGNDENHGVALIAFGEYSYTMGVNEAGLAMDQFYIPYFTYTTEDSRENYDGDLFVDILKKCTTVDEALAMFDKYNLKVLGNMQVFISDKAGTSVILEGDYIHKKDGNYQVVTNFNLSKVENNFIPCNRYKKATKGLEDNNLGIKDFENILDTTKQNLDASHPTLFSYIFNLTNGDIHLYSMGDFTKSLTYNIYEELDKGDHTIYYKELIPNERQEQYLAMYKKTRPKYRKVDTSELKKYTGTYKYSDGDKVKIILNEGSLYYNYKEFTYELLPSRNNKFFARKEKYTIHFKTNSWGKVVGLSFNAKRLGYHEAKKVLF